MPALLAPVDAYRLWAATWETDPSPIVSLESRFLSPWLNDLRGKALIDVSCGSGRWLAHAGAGGAAFVGMDFCREMLMEAAKKPDLAGRLTLADARRLPVPDCCADVALSALSLGHISPLESAISELARIVRRGGTVVISDFHPDAIRRGWKRTFRHEGQSYEIETCPYTRERLLDCASEHGLVLESLIELCFGEPERKIFAEAGKADLFEQVCRDPAVLLARWTRP